MVRRGGWGWLCSGGHDGLMWAGCLLPFLCVVVVGSPHPPPYPSSLLSSSIPFFFVCHCAYRSARGTAGSASQVFGAGGSVYGGAGAGAGAGRVRSPSSSTGRPAVPHAADDAAYSTLLKEDLKVGGPSCSRAEGSPVAPACGLRVVARVLGLDWDAVFGSSE